MINTLNKFTRVAKCLVCLTVAVFVVWRGNHYVDAHSLSAIPQVMCAIFGVFIAFTGVALAVEKK
jgi:hypothetical protein